MSGTACKKPDPHEAENLFHDFMDGGISAVASIPSSKAKPLHPDHQKALEELFALNLR